MRGATDLFQAVHERMQISIHAPHARSDLPAALAFHFLNHFNPRSSCEERLHLDGVALAAEDFNPRSSCEERHTFQDIVVD